MTEGLRHREIPIRTHSQWLARDRIELGWRESTDEISAKTFLIGLLSVVFAAAAVVFTDSGWPILVLIGGFIGMIWVHKRQKSRRCEIAKHRLDGLDVMDDRFIGIVMARFLYCNSEYGCDVGVMSMDEEFIHFEGWQTSFALSGNEFAGPYDSGGLVLRHAPDYKVRFTRINSADEILQLKTRVNWTAARRRTIAIRNNAPANELVVRLPPNYPNPHISIVEVWFSDVLAVTAKILLVFPAVYVVWLSSFLGNGTMIRLFQVSTVVFWLAYLTQELVFVKRRWELRRTHAIEMAIERQKGRVALK